MEIKLDIGQDTNALLRKITRIKQESIDVVACEAISLGARILYSSLKKQGNEQATEEELLKDNLNVSLQHNELLAEILSMVFDKGKSKLGAYDVDTVLHISQKLAKRTMQNRDKL